MRVKKSCRPWPAFREKPIRAVRRHLFYSRDWTKFSVEQHWSLARVQGGGTVTRCQSSKRPCPFGEQFRSISHFPTRPPTGLAAAPLDFTCGLHCVGCFTLVCPCQTRNLAVQVTVEPRGSGTGVGRSCVLGGTGWGDGTQGSLYRRWPQAASSVFYPTLRSLGL